MAVFKFLNANGQWETVDTVGAIKYIEQSLSEEQKAQALQNLGLDSLKPISYSASMDDLDGGTEIWILTGGTSST